MVTLLIQIISGAVGGNIAANIFKDLDLGPLGNSIAGVLGGGIGGLLLNALGIGAGTGGSLELGTIIGNIVSGGVGGGILMAIVGLIKSLMGGNRLAARGASRPSHRDGRCARLARRDDREYRVSI